MSEIRERKSGKLLRAGLYVGGLGSVLGLLVCLLRIWNWEPEELSRQLLLEAGRALDCTVQVRGTEIRKFPFPRVVWNGTSLLWAENSHATVETLVASPDLLSMIMGRLRISSLELAGLDAPHDSWKRLLEGLRESIPRAIEARFFGMRLSNSKVETSLAEEEPLLLSNLGVSLNRKLSGIDLTLNFDLERPGKGMVLRGVALQFYATRDHGSALAGRISVQEPLLSFTGEIRGLSNQGFDELLLRSSSLDLTAARDVLQVFQKVLPLPRELSELFGAGKLLDLEFKIRGKSPKLSWECLGLEVKGRLQGAELVLPGPWGVLKNSEAGLRFSGDTLELSSLRAKAAAGNLREGSLRLGLTTPDPALFVEAWFEAEMRELHRVLEERGREEPWGSQVSAFYRVGGRARGKLVLQGTMASPRSWLDVQELVFLARHREFPYAIEMKAGSLLAGPEGFSFQGLMGTLGSSSFSEVSGSLDISGEAWLNLRTGSCVLELEEVGAFLKQKGAGRGFLESLSSLEGRLRIRELELNGPLLEPEAWRGWGSAHLEGRIVRDLLGAQVELKSAELEFTQESLSVKQANLKVGGEKFYVEGELLHWLDEEKSGEVRIQGHIGREIWGVLREPLTRLTGISWRELPRAELLHSKLAWSPDGITLRAELSLEGETRASVEILLGDSGFRIRELRVQDPETDAVFSLDTVSGAWELAVKGYVSGRTMDLFTEENPLGGGWVKGEAEVKGYPPDGFMFTGEITAGNIPMGRLLGGGPWELIQGKVLGNGREVFLETARLNRLGREVLLRGEGSLWKGGLEARAYLETIALGWEELGEITQELTNALGTSLTGTLALRIGELQVGNTFIAPFHADLELDPSGFGMDLKYALFCGVNLSGRIRSTADLNWTLHPVARTLELKEFLGCLGWSFLGFTGKVDLDGEIWGEGFESDSLEKTGGSLRISFGQGEIREGSLWPRILEALKGFPELGDWPKKAGVGGIRLDKGGTNLELDQGNLKIKELWLEGGSVEVLARGEVDLFSGGLHLAMLLELKGIRPKSSEKKEEKRFVALGLEGSFQEPRVYRLQEEKIPKEFMQKLKKPQAPKTKARPTRKTGKAQAK